MGAQQQAQGQHGQQSHQFPLGLIQLIFALTSPKRCLILKAKTN
jgi:hypothetical protein